MDNYSWQCPYCRHNATITENNTAEKNFLFDKENVDGLSRITCSVVICPNALCRQYMITAQLCSVHYDSLGHSIADTPRATWQLRPASQAKPMPQYIPAAITQDYEEACAIQNLSPKASATLSRRCLQGMIRDYFKVSRSRLIDEIEAIRDQVDPDTWESIDAVRKLGNIGAHMEKDINVIVEVDKEEAGLLISLIESLIEDWYVARYNREQRTARIKATAAQKEAARKGMSDGI